MKNYFKIMTFAIVLAGATLFVLNTNAADSEASVEILGGSGTYNISGSIDLSGRAASVNIIPKDTVNATFADKSFLISDMKGDDTWNIQIHADDLVNGTHIIPKESIFIKNDSSLIKTGDTGCDVTSDLTAAYVSLSSDRVWLQKASDDGRLCKASISPTIGIDIPAGQAVGVYTGNLVVTAGGTQTMTYDSLLSYD